MITKSKQFFIAALEKALNGYLFLDPESATRLKNVAPKIVKVELLNLNLHFHLVFTPTKIQLSQDFFPHVDTLIKGTPLRLLHMALASNRKQFFADDVVIEGDLDLAQQVIDLFDQLDIDWEDYAARMMGDVPAHQLGKIFRQIKKWGQQTQETVLQDVNEYVHEEINLFPTNEALQDFFADVDQLRMDADRLDARLQQLQKSIAQEGSKR
jgi:ubiquinone biosynthesis protein UbiJ